jgi:hypothetical protein
MDTTAQKSNAKRTADYQLPGRERHTCEAFFFQQSAAPASSKHLDASP